ncbi:MAG: HAMP domain-containing histidine kinase [Lachnospiraceae bacterium]|nr:HAMP domain-containing histidine kinase [Lachnospiraceae bacterium]
MKEREQTEKWLFSTSGKLARGLFCMLTFCVFMTGLVFSVYGILHYGSDILHFPKADYFQSNTYQIDVSNEASSLMYSLATIYEKNFKEFSITDVEKRTITFYDLIAMMQDCQDGMSIEDVMNNKDRYKIRTLNCGFDLSRHSQILEYLFANAALIDNNFLYFSEEAFQNLFKTGASVRQNAEHMYSEYFSESAYFVFAEDGQYVVIFGDDTAKSEEENGAEEEKLEEAIIKVPEVECAVYDPEKNLYYSTSDNYFTPMGSYIYSSYDLKNEIGEPENIEGSIIFSLLKADNLDNGGIWSRLNQQSGINIELAKVNTLENSSFYYYVKNSQYEKSNVESLEDITSLQHAYRMVGKNALEYGRTNSEEEENLQNVESLDFYNVIEEAFSYLPQDIVFYFGINPNVKSADDGSRLIQSYQNYENCSRGGFAVVIAAIALILLFLQAGLLIYTTGKKRRGDKQVILNSFDRLPTELWILLFMAVLVGCSLLAVLGGRIIYFGDMNIRIVMLQTALSTVPFGFSFMMLTLSFVRRMRAHNMKERSFLYKFLIRAKKNSGNLEGEKKGSHVKGLRENLKEFFYSLKGTDKLLILFAGYVILMAICWFLPQRRIGFGLFILLDIAALAAIVYAVRDLKELTRGVTEITKGNLDYKVSLDRKNGLFKELNDGINHIGDGIKAAVETSIKDERMKTELITNVSHDLKTPLTSIINYINLLKTEKMPTPEAEHYVEVLESKAQRLRHLTEDLVEAAKATSGNIELEKMPLAFNELMKQALGEFEDKFATRDLKVVVNIPEEPVIVLADGRRMFRIIENVLQNAYKYAHPGTRIYADLSNRQSVITFILKNISAAPLNISPEELMERFTRGDSARSTEGSGLGLSIAKDLTRLQGGTFDIKLDGDLFKVIITFPEYDKTQEESESKTPPQAAGH